MVKAVWYMCRMNAITASVTAVSSSDRPAGERPTRPLPRTALQMAIAFASPGGHAGNNSQILSASLSTSALSSPLQRSASRSDGRPAPPRRTGTPPALSPARLLHEDPLTLVALAASAELDNDGGQCAVFPSAAAQRGIPGGHIDQVVHLGAS